MFTLCTGTDGRVVGNHIGRSVSTSKTAQAVQAPGCAYLVYLFWKKCLKKCVFKSLKPSKPGFSHLKLGVSPVVGNPFASHALKQRQGMVPAALRRQGAEGAVETSEKKKKKKTPEMVGFPRVFMDFPVGYDLSMVKTLVELLFGNSMNFVFLYLTTESC